MKIKTDEEYISDLRNLMHEAEVSQKKFLDEIERQNNDFRKMTAINDSLNLKRKAMNKVIASYEKSNRDKLKELDELIASI